MFCRIQYYNCSYRNLIVLRVCYVNSQRETELTVSSFNRFRATYVTYLPILPPIKAVNT